MTANDRIHSGGDVEERIERALEAVLRNALGHDAPVHLSDAMRAAVFPGGARIRPRLCLRIFHAGGATHPALAESAAVAIELLHCASLVHDDLPCFDNALLRRGQPTVHRAFGESTAVLAGDALIVLAFRHLNHAAVLAPGPAVQMTEIVANAIGPRHGLIAGQSMETMAQAPIDRYHHCKTGSLFVAAAVCGALASGADPAPWAKVGELLGQAYQIADDIADTAGTVDALGKLPDMDTQLDRPSIVRSQGLDGAIAKFNECIERIGDAVPAGPHKTSFVEWLNQALCQGVAGPGKAGLIRQQQPQCESPLQEIHRSPL